MAKAMSKSKIVAALAEKTAVTKKTSAAYLEALASLAHKEAKNGFTIPGVGKLVVRQYKARMGRNPQTGEAINKLGLPFGISNRRNWGLIELGEEQVCVRLNSRRGNASHRIDALTWREAP